MESQFKYYAFISYSSKDKKWAKWLQKKLETYKFPSKTLKENPYLPKYIRPIFRDNTDLRGGILPDILYKELEKSEKLVVICSPNSAQSDWVGKEIDYFIKLKRKEPIILFIINGEPNSPSIAKECFHVIIRQKLPPILGINIQENGKEHAFIKVVATLFNLDFDALWQRHRRRLIHQRIFSVFFIFSILAALIFVWYINQPFDMKVQLIKTHQESLPFPESGVNVDLILHNQVLSQTLYSADKPVIFPNIPAKYKDTEVRLRLSGTGYPKKDTIMELKENILLPLTRDNAYFGLLRGIVRRTKSDSLVPYAKIQIEGITTTTDHQGMFELFIPLSSQHPTYEALVECRGQQTRHTSLYPMQNNPLMINILYIP